MIRTPRSGILGAKVRVNPVCEQQYCSNPQEIEKQSCHRQDQANYDPDDDQADR